MALTMESLRALYVALGGSASAVADLVTIPDMLAAIATQVTAGGGGGGGASVAAVSDLINSGAKNIIQNNITGVTKNGVTAVVNSDGSITLSGTSNKSSSFMLFYDFTDSSLSNSYSSKIPAVAGEYVLKGTNDSRVKVQAFGYTTEADQVTYANSKDDVTFTVAKPYISFRVYIAANADFTTPLTVYPMCCLKSAYDVSSAYVPYVPSASAVAEYSELLRYENPVTVTWFDGKFVSNAGVIGDDVNYSISSPIKMRKGQRIVFSATGGSATSILTKFVNGEPTPIFDGTATPPMRYLIPYKFWIADEDCEVVICHDIRANSSNIIIPNEDVRPTIFNDEQFLSGSPLWQKKMVVVGDSLVKGSRLGEFPTWCNWIAAKYRMVLVNAGINGSSIAEIPEGADGENLHDPIVDRYNALLQENKDADLVVYEGGANDRTWGVPIGSVSSNAKTEFIGAIGRIINGTRIICPKSKIFFISLPWRWSAPNETTGLDEADYAEAMKTICEAKSIPCRNPCFMGDVDFRDTSVSSWADEGIWIGEEANRHYSPAGYQYIIPRIERFLSE